MRITIEEYDPAWAAHFQRLAARYTGLLSGVPAVRVEHVGSTSVPELVAKPILDIDIVVDKCDIPAAIRVLEGAGHISAGELGIADRWVIRQPADWREWDIAVNLYVIAAGCAALRNHLAVRDALRRSAELRLAYKQVKMQLASSASMQEYCEGKTSFLLSILRAESHCFTVDELAEIEEANR